MFYPRAPLFLRFSRNVFAFLRGAVRLDLLATATTIRPPLTESALTLCAYARACSIVVKPRLAYSIFAV